VRLVAADTVDTIARKHVARTRRKPTALVIGSEALPFAKTGGLADVLGALPPALGRLGWDVTLVLPKYRTIPRDLLSASPAARIPLNVGAYPADAAFFEVPLADGARAVLVDVADLYDREGLYGQGDTDFADNPRRFAVLVRAALEFGARQPNPPAVVHAHDWQAGLAPVYLRTFYANHPVLGGTPSVFTIHNLAYQGLFPPDWLPRLDLPWDLLALERLEFWGKISFLKGGINDARIITTVSRKYAAEIQTPELGFGFDGILRRRSPDLVGILNGIDDSQWNPALDPFLSAQYSAADLTGKSANRLELLKRFGLLETTPVDRPVIGMISRMVDQKGLDLIAAAAADLMSLDAAWIVLGTGEARYQDLWRDLASRSPDRVGVRIGFDEALAHLIEAGADMFLMPSRFEPCGLNQMYSLKYGTVPVVRAVGGLADTVKHNRTGFTFEEYTPVALVQTLRTALRTFPNKQKWRALQAAGMKQDHSWDRSAREYVRIYDRLTGGRPDGPTGPTGRLDRPPEPGE
jgi:starch synthase